MRYQMHEGSFTVPDGWQDQTIHTFKLNDNGTNVTINRQRNEPHQPLDSLVDDQLKWVKTNVDNFQRHTKKSVNINGYDGMQLEYSFITADSPLHQLTVLLTHEQDMILFTLSAPNAIADHHKTSFLKHVSTFTFEQSVVDQGDKA